jgi:predicted  nucleic acid-binding Zn-ribbon protein
VNAKALLALQLVDSELDHLAGERKRLPERTAVAAATSQHASWKAEEARLSAIIKEATDKIAAAEREGADLDAKRARLESQLKTVTTQRQADALTHEIDTIRQHHSDLDDGELAAMESQSDAEAALAALAAREDDVRSAVETTTGDLDRAMERLATDEQVLAAKRAEADAALTDEERTTYAALRTRFGGVGICQLEGRRCTGCHLDLSASEADQVQHAPADELPECPHCGRLIAR